MAKEAFCPNCNYNLTQGGVNVKEINKYIATDNQGEGSFIIDPGSVYSDLEASCPNCGQLLNVEVKF